MQRASVVPLLVVFAVACGQGEASSGRGSSSGSLFSAAQKRGIATYYDATGAGNCSFEATPDDLDVVALSPAEYGASAACGACLRVAGESGEVTVRVVDSCPSCDSGHIDLSRAAFAKIAPVEKGRVPITYQTVACDVRGNVAYHFKEGSSKYWTAIQVRNHRLPVTKLEYRRGGAYVETERKSYNYFVAAEGVGDQPSGLRVRVTAADDQVIEDELPGDIPSDVSVTGSEQFN